jgi:hypothetical protein
MAQAGFTPIRLYSSITTAAVPTAGNLVQGELAINTTDGKLFYEDSGGVVQVIATKDSAAGNFTTLDATNLEVTNLKAKDGTAAGSIANTTGVVTLASSVLTTADINGGTIDATAIGATTPSTVVATQVDITAQGDLRLQDTSGGQYVALQAPGTIATSYTLTLPVDDGTSGQALITDGSGVLSWAVPSVSTNVTVTTSATASDFKVPFANTTASTTGNYGLLQDSTATFTYNPSTNTLVVGSVTGSLTGNASTATTAATLTTARNINGTSFNGSADITTANWGTARTLWGQSVNGSADITAPLLPAAGTVSLPAFSTSGDTNTGIFFPAADTIAFAEGGAESMRIDSSGNVVIGAFTAAAKLDVRGGTSFTVLQVAGAPASTYGGQIKQINENVGVPTPNKFTRVSDLGEWQVVNSSYSAICMTLTDAGAANKGDNSSTWTVVSDARLKQNIRPITNALGKICALNPCHFEYITRPGKIKTNFIAQEFETVFPGHVSETSPGMEFRSMFPAGEKIKSIDADIIPYLVAAIKEQRTIISAMEARLATLEA